MTTPTEALTKREQIVLRIIADTMDLAIKTPAQANRAAVYLLGLAAIQTFLQTGQAPLPGTFDAPRPN
jgi:hypothetical protein